jgi:hypothetical protein
VHAHAPPSVESDAAASKATFKTRKSRVCPLVRNRQARLTSPRAEVARSRPQGCWSAGRAPAAPGAGMCAETRLCRRLWEGHGARALMRPPLLLFVCDKDLEPCCEIVRSRLGRCLDLYDGFAFNFSTFEEPSQLLIQFKLSTANMCSVQIIGVFMQKPDNEEGW